MNAWLVRPTPHGINRMTEFKNLSIVAIGWPGIGDLTGKSREELKALLQEKPYELSSLALGNAYATIDIFVNQIVVGDLILTPNNDDIYLGKITSDYFMDATADTNDAGYGHRRKVEWLNHCSRKNLSKELRSSLKVHRTTADLSHHFAEIQALSEGRSTAAVIAAHVPTQEVSFPLRPDFLVKLEIPTDMTKDEANRLSTFFSTLYFQS